MTCLDCDAPLPLTRGPGRRRCAACAAAVETTGLGSASIRDGRPRIPVSCWCEATTVWVPVDVFRAGRTLSCGAPLCEAA